jgi:hypothetical protein
MTRRDVRSLMPRTRESFRKGEDSEHEMDVFHRSGFQVHYGGDDELVEFVELFRDSGFKAIYRDMNVFAEPADAVIAHVSESAKYDKKDPEMGCSYVFRKLEMSLWRPFEAESPDEVEGWFFNTVGVGAKGYFSRAK